MHVELRFSYVSKACAFDVESFYRMKQLMALQSRMGKDQPRGSVSQPNTQSAATEPGSEIAIAQSKKNLLSIGRSASSEKGDFVPKLCIQFVFERVVKLESSVWDAHYEHQQHETQIQGNWDGSEVRTQRYSVSPKEAVLTSLPASMVDCIVKIRLLQLPPPLANSTVQHCVDEAIGQSDNPTHHSNTPLCIGVSKITLRELLSIRGGGLCMALQPKKTMVQIVEESNLNTVATNSMFGRDIGGSAFFTFQVLAYSFNRVPISKLLFCGKRIGQKGESTDPGSASRQPSVHNFDTSTGGGRGDASSHLSIDSFQDANIESGLNSAAVRFVLVPYMSLVDMVLRLNDVFSWRRPLKTVVALLIVALLMAADMFDIGLVAFFFLEVLLVLRATSIFYRIPPVDSDGGAWVSPLATNSAPQVFLYGRHNTTINALVRARLFFSQGLQEDCFLEMALVFHIVRRNQHNIVIICLAAFVCTCLLSIAAVAIVAIFSGFFIYPLSIRVPNISNRKRSKSKRAFQLSALPKMWMLNSPVKVARVVQVAVAAPASVPAATTLPHHSGAESQQVAMKQLEGTPRLVSVVPTGTPHSTFMRSELTPPHERTLYSHRRALTQDADFFARTSMLVRQQFVNASCLSFAMVSFVCEPITGGFNASVNTYPQTFPCQIVVEKLHKHFARVKLLQAAVLAKTTANQRGNSTVAASQQQLERTVTLDTEKNLYEGKTIEEMNQQFFSETFSLLCFLRRQCSFQVYISLPSSPVKLAPSDLLRLGVFVRPQWLLEQGEDDGITATLLAMSRPSIQIGKLSTSPGADSDARALALVAAYLLQGSRLSIYNPGVGGRNCCIIFPLTSFSDRFEPRQQPNPCPPSLVNFLEEVWRGSKEESDGVPMFTVEVILRVIDSYRRSGTNAMLSHQETTMTEDANRTNNVLQALQRLKPFSPHSVNHSRRSPRGATFYGAMPDSRSADRPHLSPSRDALVRGTSAPSATVNGAAIVGDDKL